MRIIETFQDICRNHPTRIAIRDSLGDISYGELLRRVNGLAATLGERLIGDGSRVAIHLERSSEMIIAILSTLSTGAAYIPLDPENPSVRLQQIVEDSNPAVILSRVDGNELADVAGIPLLDPADWSKDGPLLTPPESSRTAYIAYTSGSTGKPKGVVIEHTSLENYLDWALSTLCFSGGGVPLIGSISFDHSVTSYLPPLMKGEMLILLPPLEGGRALGDSLLTGHHYSYVKITPSHARLLTIDQRAQLGLSTDLLIFGGERLPPELVYQARRDNPSLAILNHYGPTEATVGCCVYFVPSVIIDPTIIPIGQPIPGVEAVIRLDDGRFAESGEAGELLIGGKALAQGYWRQPDLSAEAFVQLSDMQGNLRRWYRTGDSVRRSNDGNFQFLGRLDDQIKILGHRIELAEIEQVLLSHPSVREAAVLAGARNDAVEIIAAVMTADPNLGEDDLRGYLRLRIPSVMVPSRILFFDTWPMTAGGKLDRQLILETAEQRRTKAFEGTIEDLLAGKFREALGLSVIQPTEDFFELGGDSIAAVEIITWASEQFQITLETPALFDNPTIRSLAEQIRSLVSQPVPPSIDRESLF
jgi:amino acid adenylation domain-containing protein